MACRCHILCAVAVAAHVGFPRAPAGSPAAHPHVRQHAGIVGQNHFDRLLRQQPVVAVVPGDDGPPGLQQAPEQEVDAVLLHVGAVVGRVAPDPAPFLVHPEMASSRGAHLDAADPLRHDFVLRVEQQLHGAGFEALPLPALVDPEIGADQQDEDGPEDGRKAGHDCSAAGEVRRR